MAYLNKRALEAIANALRDAVDVYTKLQDNPEIPERLRRDYSAQRHMADTLAALFEEHPAFDAENVEWDAYKALIWEKTPVAKAAA